MTTGRQWWWGLCWLILGLEFASALDEPLRSIAEVRALSLEEAAKKPRVELEVQMLKVGSLLQGGFVYDGKDGIYLAFMPRKMRRQDYRERNYPVGSILKVRGTVAPGIFLPHLEAETVEVIEQRELSIPLEIGRGDFFEPDLDCQWVTFTGTIVGLIEGTQPKQMGIQLKCYDRVVNLLVNRQVISEEYVKNLIHDEVVIKAVAATKANRYRQMLARFFHVSCEEHIIPVQQAESELIRIHELMRRGSSRQSQRVKVRGVVIHVSDRALYLRGEKACLYAKTRGEEKWQRGDLVELEGLVQANLISPILLASKSRKISSGDPPSPVPIKMEEIYPTALNHELVTVEGRLLKAVEEDGGVLLKCENQENLFEARLPGDGYRAQDYQEGSLLALTGISELSSTHFFLPFDRQIDRFQLQLRDAGDIKVMTYPPWWTMKKLAMIIGILGIVGLLALVWAIMLRSLVARQTAIISNQVQREATLEERQRLARELHDTLQQNMTGISMQLDHAQRHIDAQEQELTRKKISYVQEMLDQCRTETRESISQLRGATTTRGSLSVLVEDAMHHDANIQGVNLEMTTVGEPYQLDPFYVRHTLRIVREAFSNALHHASSKSIRVSFDYGEKWLKVTVVDDGAGFRTDANPPEGHFGLVGMRERAARINSQLSIHSKPNEGTRVVLKIPVSLSCDKDV